MNHETPLKEESHIQTLLFTLHIYIIWCCHPGHKLLIQAPPNGSGGP